MLMPQQLLEVGCDWGKLKIQTKGIRRVNKKKVRTATEMGEKRRIREEEPHVYIYMYKHIFRKYNW